jgi:glycosyltransferase involved in cell wall biosynthesis
MRSVVTKLAEDNPKDDLLFVALGDDSHSEHIGNATIRFIPYQKNSAVVAQYYQAADIYLHAARVDNFPTTVLEALACGTPVVATTVGGIPEQIKSLAIAEMGLSGVSTDQATGVLVPPQDADTMALAIEHLLNNPERLAQLGRNAAEDAKKRFDLNIQVSAYLNWYQEIIRDWRQNNIAG